MSLPPTEPSAGAPDGTTLQPSTLDFPVIGIGASAGGLEALLRFFEHLPADAGLAIVIVLHLSPAHESSAAEILQRAAPSPVRQVNRPTRLERNHVYVIPPGVELTMNDGYLRTAPRDPVRGPATTIDVFFRTLALVHQARAVCIVMSGTGSDGAVGLTRVKEQGGITMAQLPEDAAHEGMPRAAIATGMVDIVLTAAEMGPRLVGLWGNAQRIRLPDAKTLPERTGLPGGADGALQAETALQEVMALLRSYTRHDFRHYKRATVLRRIERRLQVNQLADLPAYRDFLRHRPQEARPLLQDMLISVTNFFRDAESFEALEREVFPALMQNRAPDDRVRAWVAGCATGEEAYTLSMLLREHADRQPSPVDLQIFATDIDEQAIAVARKGSYPEGIAGDVSAARLRQFFVREHDQYRVGGAIREPVLFAAHNLLSDPPFSRLDLICCRNLLIYLDRAAQAHALETFRIALKPGGILFLGSSETIDTTGNLFVPIDKKNRIFRVNPELPASRFLPLISDTVPGRGAERPPVVPAAEAAPPPSAVALHQRAIEQFAPPSVLVDEQHDVLHLSNGVGRFLERPGGEPSNNLLANVRPDIRLELRTALFKASKTGRSVETRLTQRRDDGRKSFLNITIRPMEQPSEAQRVTLVVFDEVEESMAPPPVDAAPGGQTLLVDQLEEEVRQLKLHLQDTIETSVRSNQELKASNEELQAINEELRSATEELETSKEELQSMNEELTAVNFELKTRVEERGHINDDLQNLITSSEMATVFVDRGFRIKRFTPHASRLFNLIGADVGRSLFDITNSLNYPQLQSDMDLAFGELRGTERQVTSTEGRHYMARVLPYRTAEDRIDGAILNFFDVTALHAAEERVRAGEEKLKLVAATTRDFAIVTLDRSGIVTTWNLGAERIFGWSEEEMVGNSISAIFTEEDRERGVPEQEIRTAEKAGRAEDERWHRRRDGGLLYCSGVMTPIDGDPGRGFAKIARDMTGTKRQELVQEHRLMQEKKAHVSAQTANELKDRFLAVMSHELKQPLNLIQMNAELLTRLPVADAHPVVRRLGETIKQAIGSQTRIINDLLDLSRVRTGKLRLHRVAVDLVELARSLAGAATSSLVKKLTLELQADGEVRCFGDRVRVEQVVWNLLSNAVKFTPDGGRIVVRIDADGDFARVVVSDSGCGIAPEFLPHVFGMFNQADASAAPANGGLGIGLALVQELTRAHGGRVEVSSEGEGRGATFSVWLPLLGRDVHAPPEPAPTVADFKGCRILVVDDYAEGLLPFAEVLRLEGAVVDVADGGRKALELLEAGAYDLLISDLGMPEMDGYQLIAEVRRRPKLAELPAIAMSGFGRRADARRALAAGFNAHVPKPAAIEDLQAALGRI